MVSAVTLRITAGLTGMERGLVAGKEYHYTKNAQVIVVVDASTSPGTIVEKILILSDWRTLDALVEPPRPRQGERSTVP